MHRRANFWLGVAKSANHVSSSRFSLSMLEKKRLCVTSRLATRQTCSMGLRSGEYGGISKNDTLSRMSWYSSCSRMRRLAFLCQGALSSIIQIRLLSFESTVAR